MTLVGIVLGSTSDEKYVTETQEILDSLGIDYETTVLSAHRKPKQTAEYAESAEQRGLEILIGLAGAAAALPGTLAALTSLPVIGVPLPSSDLKGIDSLYSIVQMPPGVPVAAVGIGSMGARNAAYLAASILSIKHESIRTRYKKFRQNQSSN
jgi:5-(carboxyamino)imidazole ribonucleotide mutase